MAQDISDILKQVMALPTEAVRVPRGAEWHTEVPQG